MLHLPFLRLYSNNGCDSNEYATYSSSVGPIHSKCICCCCSSATSCLRILQIQSDPRMTTYQITLIDNSAVPENQLQLRSLSLLHWAETIKHIWTCTVTGSIPLLLRASLLTWGSVNANPNGLDSESVWASEKKVFRRGGLSRCGLKRGLVVWTGPGNFNMVRAGLHTFSPPLSLSARSLNWTFSRRCL